jgi:hypothetical protein
MSHLPHRAAALLGAALLSVVASACREAEADPPAAGTQYIVGIDISGSRTPTQLREAEELLAGLVGRMTNGDRLVLVETYQTGTDAARQWDDSIPAPRRSDRLTAGERKKAERFRSSAAMVARTFFDTTRSRQIKTTDLLATLRRAADYAKAGHGRPTTVLLLSDMLNATPELNMERAGGIPDSAWVAQREAEGRLPDLRGVCVYAVGGDVGSARGVRARAFWRAYFTAAGARYADEHYRNMVSDAGEVRCS